MGLFGLGVKLKDLQDLYIEQLRDLYSAETQLLEALPQMEAAATAPELKQGFADHLEETRIQVQRLETIFQDLGEKSGGHTCKAMEGLVAEGSDMIGEKANAAVKDAGLIAAAQRVEHYEIAGYGTVATYARVLGHQQHLELLRLTENEEKAADSKLTGFAQEINLEAAQA